MVPAERTPDYLKQLGVTVTQSLPADSSIDVFQEFLAAKPTKRVECIFEFETTGFLYMSELQEFVAASMVLTAFRVNGFSTSQFRVNASLWGQNTLCIITPKTRSYPISRVVMTGDYRP